VQRSSDWYQKLLNCDGIHGGDTFEMLANTNNAFLLCLHKWGEHEHPTITKPIPENGNGLILYIRVGSLEDIWQRAIEIGVKIEEQK